MFEQLPDAILGDRQATIAELRRRLSGGAFGRGVSGAGAGAGAGVPGTGVPGTAGGSGGSDAETVDGEMRGSGMSGGVPVGVSGGLSGGGLSGGGLSVGSQGVRLGGDSGPLDQRAGYLPVIDALSEVLPGGGLPRGGVVGLTGSGSTSVLFTLLAGPSAPWSALVGLPNLGLLAAAELGVDLNRVVLIPDPGLDVLQVLSVLADGVDLIAVRVGSTPLAPPARLRVLQGRLRQRGTVLVAVGPWAGADLSLAVTVQAWRGIGAGHGRLTARELGVAVTGRGAGGRIRHTRLLLAAGGPGEAGRVLVTTAPVEEQGAGLSGVGMSGAGLSEVGLPEVGLPVAVGR